jgi:hypothetical protein
MANPTWGQISARLIRPLKKPEIALFLRRVNLDLTGLLKSNRCGPCYSAPMNKGARTLHGALFYGSLSGEA